MTKMKHIAKALGLLLILALLILSLPPAPAWAQNPQPSSKISSLLALQVEIKLRLSQGELPEAMANILELGQQGNQLKTSSPDTGNLTTQRLFVHLTEAPTELQIQQMQTLGITLYPDSWIPPVGNHPTGFLVADMPLDKLNELAARDYVLSLDSAERTARPQNDLGATAINAPDVWNSGYDGSGIKIAILDSGLDVNHPDIPPPIESQDYSDWPNLDDTIANTVTGHGTHVTGTALGRGTQSAGQYKGTAPASDLIFLKIGNDSDGTTTADVEVAAIGAAVDIYDADIITISYGGWGLYHDGSEAEAQAVDYAFSKGAVVLVAAGNEASSDWHYSDTVPPGGETDYIPVNVGSSLYSLLYFNLVCYDGLGTHNDLDLHYYDSSHSELTNVTSEQSESPRGTESELSYYNYLVSPGTYYLKVKNKSTASQSLHIYFVGIGTVTFQNPDPFYTICSPADADNAISVGAYTTRKNWTDYQGNSHHYINPEQTVDTVISFSSRGPRVDGAQKPNILAPGSAIISCRDGDIYTWPNPSYDPLIIDNDGLNLNGSGPADYFLMAGTSMSSPMAAGAAALLLQAHPELKGNPSAVIDRLQQSGSMADSPDYIWGYGLIDIHLAITGEAAAFDPWAYDVNDDDAIQKTEALAAIADYFDLEITKSEALEVIALYFG